MGQMRDFCHVSPIGLFSMTRLHSEIRNTPISRLSQSGLSLKLEESSSNAIAQFESLLRDNRTFSRSSETAEKITGAADFLDDAFPEKCAVLRNRVDTL